MKNLNLKQILKLSKLNMAVFDSTNTVIIDLILDQNPFLEEVSKDDFLKAFRLGHEVVNKEVDYLIKSAISFVDSTQTLSDLDLIEKQERKQRLSKGSIVKTIELVEEPQKVEGSKHYKVATVCTRCKNEHSYSLHYLAHTNFKGCSSCRSANRTPSQDYSIGSVFGVYEIISEKEEVSKTPNGRANYRVKVRCVKCNDVSERDLYSLRHSIGRKSCRKCKKVGYANHRQKHYGRIFKQRKTGKMFEIIDSTPSEYVNGKRIKTTLYKMVNIEDGNEITWQELSNLNSTFYNGWQEVFDEKYENSDTAQESGVTKCRKNLGRRFEHKKTGDIYEIVGFKPGRRVDGIQIRPLYHLKNLKDGNHVSHALSSLLGAVWQEIY